MYIVLNVLYTIYRQKHYPSLFLSVNIPYGLRKTEEILVGLRVPTQLTHGYISEILVRLRVLTQCSPNFKTSAYISCPDFIQGFYFEAYMQKEFFTKDGRQRVLYQWQQSANFFSKHFVDKLVTYKYKKDNHCYEAVIRFQKHNFQHLMGITYKHGAQKFWTHVNKNNVDFEAVVINNYNAKRYKPNSGDFRSVFQKKLAALQDINVLTTNKARICEQGKIGKIIFDHLIRSNRLTIALATKELNNSKNEFFISNINLNYQLSKKLNGYKLISLYSSDLKGDNVKTYF
ncbi:hypothetical protein R53140_OCIKHKEL_00702 [Fructobacillus fructosus]|nr:hypothetical protein R53140_OCIKHKEL_00702 [Fructobacillus fructosus]